MSHITSESSCLFIINYFFKKNSVLVFNMDSNDWWLVSLSLSFIILAFQVYGLYYFKSIRHLLIVQKRYPNLVILEAIACIIHCSIMVPLRSYEVMQATNFGFSASGTQSIYTVGLAIPLLTFYFVPNLELSRLWLMSFHLHYLQHSKNEKWQSQIDRNAAINDWYIANKNTFGNPKFVIKRSMIYYIVSTSIISITFVSFPQHHRLFFVTRLINGTLGGIPVFIALYIYWKCPKHIESNDNFLFHYEFKATILIYLMLVVIYVISSLFRFLEPKHMWGISIWLIWLIVVFPSLLSSLWIPKKILSTETWGKQNKFNEMLEIDETKSITQRFQETLLNETNFEPFIHWMYREFSSEVILCFIELVQFKEFLIKRVEETSQEQIECEYSFYENMPKSSIVFNEEKNIEHDEEYKTIAHKLYIKYIQMYSEHEINISSLLRQRYQALEAGNWNVDIREMVNVFDRVIEEMFVFIRESYGRFEAAM